MRAENKYARPKRRQIVRSIYSDWDKYVGPSDPKCWKTKRKTQYRVGGRGKRYAYFIETDSYYSWDYKNAGGLEEYFDKQKIPYSVEIVKEQEVRYELITHTWVDEGWVWYDRWVGSTKPNGVRHTMIIRDRKVNTVKKKLAKPYYKERHYVVTKGFLVTWWTNRNLDLTEFGVQQEAP